VTPRRWIAGVALLVLAMGGALLVFVTQHHAGSAEQRRPRAKAKSLALSTIAALSNAAVGSIAANLELAALQRSAMVPQTRREARRA
jgi:hypothetical protein